MPKAEELDAIITEIESAMAIPSWPENHIAYRKGLGKLSQWNRDYQPEVRRMPIEIEVFQREPNLKNRAIKVWVNGNLIYANEIATPKELRDWRDALDNEVRWLSDYLEEEGL